MAAVIRVPPGYLLYYKFIGYVYQYMKQSKNVKL